MMFEPRFTDRELSPYTGLTRKSWIDAGKYLLEGLFRHIKSADAPPVPPRHETEITYPHRDATCVRRSIEESAERFEGLARTFLIAAPLIHDDPAVAVCGYSLRDYYSAHILRCCSPGDECYIGSYSELAALTGSTCFQQTVETCALVIGLWACRDEIWAKYSRQERDRIADLLSGYAHGHTVTQNWRLFNMLVLAFLHNEGYPIDTDVMTDHAANILMYYAGDGWYRDGHTFDYYSCWGFNFYAPLWNVWYGYEHMPQVAQKFEQYSHELMKTYPDFFDRDGHTNMWGRSNIYRFASVSAFDGNLLLPKPSVDFGLARRIASGSLLQFLLREDFLQDGIPAMGFYGQFSPLVQGYSCAGSVYWLGKAFLLLHLPAEHPFWTAKENNGSWERLAENEVKSTVLDGPALAFTNHRANGTTFLRTGKVVKNKGDRHSLWNYSKLVYASKYPWESAPRADVESMQYVIAEGDETRLANVTLWRGEREGALYRRQFFDFELATEEHWLQAIDLADFPVPYGIFRADRLRLVRRPVTVTLGSFGFPDNKTSIEKREKDGQKAIILRGFDAAGAKKQMAMTVFDGFDDIDVLESSGTDPDSPRSLVIYATAARTKEYGYEPYLLLSQVITREDHIPFTDGDLFPLRAVRASDPANRSAFGKTELEFCSGKKVVLDFSGVEGELKL